MKGKPITTFLVTALALWAVYLWRHGRLGKLAMLPSNAPDLRGLQYGGGWIAGQPPVLPHVPGTGGPK